jgi:hypothetical protein
VGLLSGDQELGSLRVGLERVGSHDHALQVQTGQQLGKGGDLLGRAGDLALGQHDAADVVHRRQQVHRAAVTARGVGAAQGLAVDGDRPPPVGCGSGTVMLSMAIAVGQPRADHTGQQVGLQARKRPADGGLGRDGQAAGGLLSGAEHNPDLLGRISGPFGDRGDRPRPCQHRRGGQSQDGDQPVAAATGSSWVGDAGQIGQQVWGFGVVELAGGGVGELGERGWDRG